MFVGETRISGPAGSSTLEFTLIALEGERFMLLLNHASPVIVDISTWSARLK